MQQPSKKMFDLDFYKRSINRLFYIESYEKRDKIFGWTIGCLFALILLIMWAAFVELYFWTVVLQVLFAVLFIFAQVLAYKNSRSYTFYVWEGNNSNVKKLYMTYSDFIIYTEKNDMSDKGWGSPCLNVCHAGKNEFKLYTFTFYSKLDNEKVVASEVIFSTISSFNLPSIACTYGGRFSGIYKNDVLTYNADDQRFEVNNNFNCTAKTFQTESKQVDPLTLEVIENE